MSSFFAWMGGKSRMVKLLTAAIPKHTCYVEVFAGAANLLFAKPLSNCEVINDINGDLVNLFRVVKHHRREFLCQLMYLTHSRRDFSDAKAQPGLTDIQRAAGFYLILRTCFGGKGGTSSPCFGYGTSGKARFNRISLSAVHRCHKRLSGVFIENLPFDDCIRRYDRPHSFFYCDPPYLETTGYKAQFGLPDHQRLAEQLRAIKGRFLLSINDHPEIRRLYKGLTIHPVSVRYTVSRDKSDEATCRKELLIANYPLPGSVKK
jgi:DNA adenine methylase